MVLPSPENENVLSLDESKHNELQRQNISATHLMKQLSQATSLGQAIGRFIVGLAFLLLSIYDFAVFFRFLVRKWKDDSKATTR
jgi:hypothetical protein